ncbi:hypothetical protein H5410_061943 [Solanum commersonii]|uniref:Uncharacterized protein n=1 Tax=Solanum commersonii TaxID=4109 RepID=A0A9J5W9D3_SOLCO|nr:hypothetical protein H5410_061943 [Solanum commersonii]
MSERLFEGDLPKGKGPHSCILAVGAELVTVQSLASLRGNVQPILLEHKLRSPDQVPHKSSPMFDQTPKSFVVGSDEEEKEEVLLKWSSRGMRASNAIQTDRIRKMRQDGLLPKEPTSTPVVVENSDTKSEDISKDVKIYLDEETLWIILGVPVTGIRIIE